MMTPLPDKPPSLIIACGALVREVQAILMQANLTEAVDLVCLPASYHTTPAKIAPRLDEKLADAVTQYETIIVGYADCGSYGAIDTVIEKYTADPACTARISRIVGDHCYAFFTGLATYDAIASANPFQFYLTDFMVRHFEGFIIKGMKIHKHPELKALYFGNYRDLLYISQIEDPALQTRAREIADYLGLTYHYRHTGYGLLTGIAQIDS